MSKKIEDQIKKRVTDWSGVVLREIKPALKLIGTDGNAFAILGKAFRAAREAGWSRERFEEFKTRATSGNYDHLLAVTQEFFDVQ